MGRLVYFCLDLDYQYRSQSRLLDVLVAQSPSTYSRPCDRQTGSSTVRRHSPASKFAPPWSCGRSAIQRCRWSVTGWVGLPWARTLDSGLYTPTQNNGACLSQTAFQQELRSRNGCHSIGWTKIN